VVRAGLIHKRGVGKGVLRRRVRILPSKGNNFIQFKDAYSSTVSEKKAPLGLVKGNEKIDSIQEKKVLGIESCSHTKSGGVNPHQK